MGKPTDAEIIEAIDVLVNTMSITNEPASFKAIMTRLNTKEGGHVASRLIALSKEGEVLAVPGPSPGLHYTLPPG